MYVCHSCKRELTLETKVGRRDECSFCRADLHCCLNCRFYDFTAPKQCREPVAERVSEKGKANFCGYFEFANSLPTGAPDAVAEQARKALDDLFKK